MVLIVCLYEFACSGHFHTLSEKFFPRSMEDEELVKVLRNRDRVFNLPWSCGKGGWKNLGVKGMLRNAVFWMWQGYHSYELTAMVICQRSSHSKFWYRWGGLSPDLLTRRSCWQLMFSRRHLLKMWSLWGLHVPVDGSTCIHLWASLNGVSGALTKIRHEVGWKTYWRGMEELEGRNRGLYMIGFHHVHVLNSPNQK